MESDWLCSFFDDPVLNDKMISEALHPAPINNEHSYSNMSTNGTITDSVLKCTTTEHGEEEEDKRKSTIK